MIIPETNETKYFRDTQKEATLDYEVYDGSDYDGDRDYDANSYQENYPNASHHPQDMLYYNGIRATTITPHEHQLETVLTHAYAVTAELTANDRLDALQNVAIYSLIIGMVISVVTALVAISTWILIPKWRTFKNYVFLMIVGTFATLYCLFEASRSLGREYWLVKATDLFLCACAWWLLIACMMFYMDIVKVFRSGVSKRKLKSSLLVWGVALTSSLISIVDDELWGVLKPLEEFDVWLLLPLLINGVVYALVLRALLRGSRARTARSAHAAQAATLTLLMSGVMLLAAVLAAEPPAAPTHLRALAQLVYVAQTIAVDVCFLILKSNRQAWVNYYEELKSSISN